MALSRARLREVLNKVREMPPRVVAAKVAAKLTRPVTARTERWRDHRQQTLLAARPADAPRGMVSPLLAAPTAEELLPWADRLRQSLARDLSHRFNLLGSGWVEVRHGVPCAGFAGARYEPGPTTRLDRAGQWLIGRVTPANLPMARQVWSVIDEGYVPIDWHRDFKSGFRWSERTWHRDISYGHLPGVDIKVPWELARMQHLPRLAWGYILARAKQHGWTSPKRYAREFRNQVLDFVATNPPQFGVNWHCAMDVSIRVANWLATYDLFVSAGHTFDADFIEVLSQSVWDHAAHVAAHLEWCPVVRGNHYLADVVGLLFASAHLPATRRSDGWLVGAIQQLIAETQLQFTPDGANFEASTCYHRLSAEMVAWGTGLALGLPRERLEVWRQGLEVDRAGRLPIRPGANRWHEGAEGLGPFPAEHFCRLQGMAAFTRALTKQDGRVPQIGDNDNGRFLKLEPPLIGRGGGEVADWDDDHLDHRPLIDTIAGLLDAPVETPRSAKPPLGTRLMRRLVERGIGPWRGELNELQVGGNRFASRLRPALAPVQAERRYVIAATGEDLLSNLQQRAFEHFGVYVARSERLFLAIRCGGRDQIGGLGHAHADQLSLEVQLDGIDLVRDPGTFVYTSWPSQRNVYRLSEAHFVPSFPGLTANLAGSTEQGLFTLSGLARAECLEWGPLGFVGRIVQGGAWVERQISLGSQEIVIVDRCGGLASRGKPSDATKGDAWRQMRYSRGYGWREEEPLDTSRIREVRTVDAGRIRLHALASKLARVNA